jgi:hypothetical protein
MKGLSENCSFPEKFFDFEVTSSCENSMELNLLNYFQFTHVFAFSSSMKTMIFHPLKIFFANPLRLVYSIGFVKLRQ